MTTSITTVEDQFLMLVSDYRLDTLYASSGSFNFAQYLESWLLFAIDEFTDICNQSLEFTPTSGSTLGYFTETLNRKNINILAQLMTLYWLQKTVQDILQMNNSLADRDFSMFSQAQNLKEKREYYIAKREELSQMLNNYAYLNNDWASWDAEDYGNW